MNEACVINRLQELTPAAAWPRSQPRMPLAQQALRSVPLALPRAPLTCFALSEPDGPAEIGGASGAWANAKQHSRGSTFGGC